MQRIRSKFESLSRRKSSKPRGRLFAWRTLGHAAQLRALPACVAAKTAMALAVVWPGRWLLIENQRMKKRLPAPGLGVHLAD